MPATRVENERIEPMAGDIKATAAEAGREALERSKHVVQEAGETALETAIERGREEGEELSASLQDKIGRASRRPFRPGRNSGLQLGAGSPRVSAPSALRQLSRANIGEASLCRGTGLATTEIRGTSFRALSNKQRDNQENP